MNAVHRRLQHKLSLMVKSAEERALAGEHVDDLLDDIEQLRKLSLIHI